MSARGPIYGEADTITVDRFDRRQLERYLWWADHPWAGDIRPVPGDLNVSESRWRTEFLSHMVQTYAGYLLGVDHHRHECPVCAHEAPAAAVGA